MRYVFMAYHHPRPEHRLALVRWTQRVAAALRAQPGLLLLGDFDDTANGRIVALSVWESKTQFESGWKAALDSLNDEPPYDLWEARPLEVIAGNELEMPNG